MLLFAPATNHIMFVDIAVQTAKLHTFMNSLIRYRFANRLMELSWDIRARSFYIIKDESDCERLGKDGFIRFYFSLFRLFFCLFLLSFLFSYFSFFDLSILFYFFHSFSLTTLFLSIYPLFFLFLFCFLCVFFKPFTWFFHERTVKREQISHQSLD